VLSKGNLHELLKWDYITFGERKTRDYALFRAQRRTRRIQRVSFGCTGGSRALAYRRRIVGFADTARLVRGTIFAQGIRVFFAARGEGEIILAKGGGSGRFRRSWQTCSMPSFCPRELAKPEGRKRVPPLCEPMTYWRCRERCTRRRRRGCSASNCLGVGIRFLHAFQAFKMLFSESIRRPIPYRRPA